MDKEIAKKILFEIKKAKKILLALHVSPDVDSVSSALSMDLFLRRMKKKTEIISYSSIPAKFFYLFGMEKVMLADFGAIDLSVFDLFVSLDSAQKEMITRNNFPQKFPPKFKIINIDHHVSNTKFGDLNLVETLSSTSEILYHLFKLWKVKIDKCLAQMLFLGIFADTGCFQYPNTLAETFFIAGDLLKKGASLNEAVLYFFRSYSFKTLRYWGKVLENMRLDESGKFLWSSVGSGELRELGIEPTEIEAAANLFAQVVVGTEFGIILMEEEKGIVRGSIRSRKDFDVSRIAVQLGGGGHKGAAGFTLKMSLSEAEKKVLEVARRSLKI